MMPHGLTKVQFDEMLISQAGVCAICYKGNGRKRLVIDHDHETGQVRGLLCSLCNTGIGMMKDDVGNLNSAIKYLSRGH